MVSLCERLEALGRTGPMPSAGELLSQLDQEFDRLIHALDAFILRRRVHEPGGD
jgi:hypothetical protein